jgi:hypothetical protein
MHIRNRLNSPIPFSGADPVFLFLTSRPAVFPRPVAQRWRAVGVVPAVTVELSTYN